VLLNIPEDPDAVDGAVPRQVGARACPDVVGVPVSSRTPALLVTELFPPALGGSAELFGNVYGRLGGIAVTVLTEDTAQETPGFIGTVRVVRERMRAAHWGLLQPTALAHHLRRAVRVRTLSAAGGGIVHCGRALPEGLHAWLARLAGGRRYICWAHGEELASAGSSRELRVLTWLVLRGAAVVLANSWNTAKLLQTFGVPAAHIQVVHPGVDTARFCPRGETAPELRRRLASGGELLLLTVGRLQRRKGHDLVLRALAALGNSLAPLRYVIAGDGDDRVRLESLATELGLGGRVTFVGAVPPAALPAYYAAADLFVHPNRLDGHDFEGFGIVFLEAAAAGLPVIAGTTGGAPEAVVHGATGLLVSGTSVDELCAALGALVSSRERREAMGRAGRVRAMREFSWDRAAALVAAAHERVASGSWPPATDGQASR
jgi:phosphatidyl-myo-inositol dimannoside synthase